MSKPASPTGRALVAGVVALLAGLTLVGDRSADRLGDRGDGTAVHRRSDGSVPMDEESSSQDLPPECRFEGAAGGGGYNGGRVRCGPDGRLAPWRSL